MVRNSRYTYCRYRAYVLQLHQNDGKWKKKNAHSHICRNRSSSLDVSSGDGEDCGDSAEMEISSKHFWEFNFLLFMHRIRIRIRPHRARCRQRKRMGKNGGGDEREREREKQQFREPISNRTNTHSSLVAQTTIKHVRHNWTMNVDVEHTILDRRYSVFSTSEVDPALSTSCNCPSAFMPCCHRREQKCIYASWWTYCNSRTSHHSNSFVYLQNEQV